MKPVLRVVLPALFALLLHSQRAFADALRPDFVVCMPGKTRVPSHQGTKCIPDAPTDCAPGYRGELGGTCVLEPCTSDQQCREDRRCQQVDVCQKQVELTWNGYGWGETAGYYLQAPPRPQPEGPPPKAWIKYGICGQDGPCEAPAECRPFGICYPTNGDPRAKILAGAPTAEVLPPDVETAGLIAPTRANGQHGRTGCHPGCTVSSTSDFVGWFALPMLVATALWRRRRAR